MHRYSGFIIIGWIFLLLTSTLSHLFIRVHVCVSDIADLSSFKCLTSSKLLFGKFDHFTLTLLGTQHTILAFLSAVGLNGR